MDTILEKKQMTDVMSDAERKSITDILASAIDTNKKDPSISIWDSSEYRNRYGI